MKIIYFCIYPLALAGNIKRNDQGKLILFYFLYKSPKLLIFLMVQIRNEIYNECFFDHLIKIRDGF